MNAGTVTESDIVIIGGGPAGSSLALQLAGRGFSVALLEKKKFPREILCGEFLSHEVTGMLKQIGLFDKFLQLGPNPIHQFTLEDKSRRFHSALQFTGYGLSRGAFDLLLLKEARERGVTVYEEHEVNSVAREGNVCRVTGVNREGTFTIKTRLTAGAFGKQNILDRTLGRRHASGKSGYFGVKFHLPAGVIDTAGKNEIAIYTADNVYCGLNFIEGGRATLAFLARQDKNIRDRKTALEFLARNNPAFAILMNEPGLKSAPAPVVYGTGNIYFGKKEFMKEDVIFTGDAAGVIAPLAGDGIGMAMENSMLLAPLMTGFLRNEITQEELHSMYQKQFKARFRGRLMTAGFIQQVLLHGALRQTGLKLLSVFPSLYLWGMRNTRSRMLPSA